MSKRRLYVIALLFSSVILQACASATLTIEVDMYDEDPRFTPVLSQDEAKLALINVEKLESAAEQQSAARRTLAIQSMQIYSDGWLTVGGSVEALGEIKSKFQDFLTTDSTALVVFRDAATSTKHKIHDYTSLYFDTYNSKSLELEQLKQEQSTEKFKESPNKSAETPCLNYETRRRSNGKNMPKPANRRSCLSSSGDNPVKELDDEQVLRLLAADKKLREMETAVLVAITDLVSSYYTLQSPSSHFYINWSHLQNYYNAQIAYVEKGSDKDRLYRHYAQTLRRDIQGLAAIAQSLTGVESLSARKLSANASAKSLMESSIAVAQEIETLRADMPSQSSARAALDSLVTNSARFFQLIDRLQDPGDPVWRIITDPSNELHWNKRFSKTYFNAEGKSEVVIVRDNPMRYRVHHGHNNPAALIKGQLEVSRAIANAALSIAGGASGLPTKSLAANDEVDTSGAEDASAALARRKALADENARLRDSALENLHRNLRAISKGLAAKPNKEQLEALKSQLTSVLDGHAPLFTSQD